MMYVGQLWIYIGFNNNIILYIKTQRNNTIMPHNLCLQQFQLTLFFANPIYTNVCVCVCEDLILATLFLCLLRVLSVIFLLIKPEPESWSG